MAITLVNTANIGNNSGTSNTLSGNYSISSSTNGLLIVGILGDVFGGVDDITSVTYNSVALTFLAKNVSLTNGRFMYLYYLANPAAGTFLITITAGSTHYLIAVAANYNGCYQGVQPDNTITNVDNNPSSTGLTTSLTTLNDNCVIVLHEQSFNSFIPPTAGSGCTHEVSDGSFGADSLFDTSVISPAGAHSMSTVPGNGSSTIGIGHIAVSILPDTFTPVADAQEWLIHTAAQSGPLRYMIGY